MRALFLANNGPLVPASRTRVFAYLPFLRQKGWSVDVRVVVPDRLFRWGYTGSGYRRVPYFLQVILRSLRVGIRAAGASRHYDVVYIQRVLFPIPGILRGFRTKIVYDFDDAVFANENSGGGVVSALQASFRRRMLSPMLRAASRVVVENPYTAEYAGRYCPSISRITGPVDTDRYRPGKRCCRNEVVLGWIGSRTTTAYLEMVKGALCELGRRHRNLRVHLVGAGPFRVEGLHVEHRPWRLETEVRDLRTFDIGLMPLPDDPWTRGKGGYKLLQYLSMGIPAVASPVGINSEILEDGVGGYLADGEEAWVSCLEHLVADPSLRRSMGAAGRRRVKDRYALAASSEHLLQVLTCAAKG